MSELMLDEFHEEKRIKVRSAEIVVHGTLEKPYYEIKYQTTDGEWHIGYSSRKLEHVFWWLDNYFEIISYEQENQNKAIAEMKELVRGHKYTNAEDGTTIEEMLNDENIGKKYAWYLSRNQCCDWMLHRLDEIAEQLKEEQQMKDIKWYEHENGYSALLYGESSMCVYNGRRKVAHTGSRNVNTEAEVMELLEKMPELLQKIFE